jgi:hypothetical protein
MAEERVVADWSKFQRFYTVVKTDDGHFVYECLPQTKIHKPCNNENFSLFSYDWTKYGFDFGPFGVFYQDHCHSEAALEALWRWVHVRGDAYQSDADQQDKEDLTTREAVKIINELIRTVADDDTPAGRAAIESEAVDGEK